MALGLLGSEEKIGLVLFSRSFKPVVPSKDAEGRIASLVLPLDSLDSIREENYSVVSKSRR